MDLLTFSLHVRILNNEILYLQIHFCFRIFILLEILFRKGIANKFQSDNHIISARRNFSREETWSTKGGLVSGSPRGWFRGRSPRTPEKLSNVLYKNKWKIYNFLKSFEENFAIFKKIFKILSHFWRKLDINLENLEIWICRRFGGRSPTEASEFIEIWVEISMETGNFCIVLMEFLRF